MHELTDDGCQPQVRLVDPADHPPEDVLVVRLHLGANNCGVDFAREKDIKFTVQKLGVLLCPPELLLRTTQRIRVRKPLPVPVHPALPLEGDARQAAKTNRRADGADAEGPDGPGGWHILVPFVTFRNSLGFGFVVPDTHGGTELLYVFRERVEPGVDATNHRLDLMVESLEVLGDAACEDAEVLVEPIFG